MVRPDVMVLIDINFRIMLHVMYTLWIVYSAVSYTHLDVYKRQNMFCSGVFLDVSQEFDFSPLASWTVIQNKEKSAT